MALAISGFGDSSHGSMRTASLGTGLRIEAFEITSADLSVSNGLPTTLTKFLSGSAQYDTTTTDATISRGTASAMSWCKGGIDVSISDITAGVSGDRKLRVVAYGW